MTVPDPTTGYAPGEERPLASYALLTGREIDRPTALDLAMHGLATQKVSRLIAKDKVTSFLRAPFTRYQEGSGQGELEEAPRGPGLRYAVGELLVGLIYAAQQIARAQDRVPA